MRIAWVVVRVAGAAAIAAAIIAQLVASGEFWTRHGLTDHSILFLNFFSFFTIDSNAFSVIVLAVGAVLLARGGAATVEPSAFGVIRGCVVTYMVVTGVVYNLLLRGVDVAEGSVVAWSNEVLHVIGPILLLLDWLLAPGRIRMRWAHLGAVVAFPLVWAAYTLLRGPGAPDPLQHRTGWYPYPFLDPRLADTGYLSVVGYVLLIAGIIAAVGAGVIAVSRRWPRIAA